MGFEMRNGCTDAKKGISGSTLKLIAVITMLIDHIGAVIVVRMILANAAAGGMKGVIPHDGLYTFYYVLRYIGRVAFPIFCFLLVEGFQKTSSRTKYALRIGGFALLSEVPFDLALSSTPLEFAYQNVYFTLLAGLLTMIAVDGLDNMALGALDQNEKSIWKTLRYPAELAIAAVGAVIAELLHTDYGAIGVVCIMILFFFRKNKMSQTVAGCVSFLWEGTAPLAFIPIAFYNGERGLRLKYIFYVFYPLHLLILYLISVAMGISGYPAV